MSRFEVYDDAGGKPRWRLKSGNGQTIASSGEAFSDRSGAKRAATAFKQHAAASTFEVYADKGGHYRWRAKSTNGQTVASSGESFSSESSAKRAADNVQSTAGGADGP